MGSVNTTKLIRHIARSFKAKEHFDDLVQVGHLALHRASLAYEDTKGAELWTYARPSVIRDMSRYLGKQKWEPSRPGEVSAHIVNKIGEGVSEGSAGRWVTDECAKYPRPVGDLSGDTPETLLLQRERLGALAIFESLDERTKTIVRLRLKGLDVRSIASMTQAPKSTVSDVYQRAIASVRSRLSVETCHT